MKRDYIIRIKDTTKNLEKLEIWSNSLSERDVIFKTISLNEYAIIHAYGCIEYLMKNILADALAKKNKNFTDDAINKVREMQISIKFAGFQDYIKKYKIFSWANKWIAGFEDRLKKTYKDVHCGLYTYRDMCNNGKRSAAEQLAEQRNAIAHGSTTTLSNHTDISEMFKKCISWVYEIADIVK